MTGKPLVYRLLPELYRRRDRANGLQLEALTAALEEARSVVERDIAGLYRNWFVETCDPAMLPYLADLVGAGDLPEGLANPRALVADAIALARRKGTYPATERLLACSTGWPVLITPSKGERTVTVDVWRDPAMPLVNVEPRRARRPGCHRFHPLGVDCRLTAVPRPFPGLDAISDRHLDAPEPLTRGDDPALLARSVEILVRRRAGGWRPLSPERLVVGDLSDWGEGDFLQYAGGRVRAIVDPELGRLRLPVSGRAADADVRVSFGYAGPGPIGGGSYGRSDAGGEAPSWVAHVHSEAAGPAPEGRPPLFASLAAALQAYRSVPGDGVIRILDSATYEAGRLAVRSASLVCPSDPNARRRLAIEAAPGEAPTVRGRLHVGASGAGLELVLRGLWIDGSIAIEGPVAARLDHCTVHAVSAMRERGGDARPIWAISADGPVEERPSLHLESCLAGPLRLAEGVQLVLRRSVVDGYGRGTAIEGRSGAALVAATLLGPSEFHSLDAVDSLFAAPVRTGRGSASYSLLAAGSDVPVVHRCITDEAPWLPFRSTRFGMPGYARVEPETPHALATGSFDGAEIGAFGGEGDGRRERLLRSALAEHLPLGCTHSVRWR